ncbi:hypothetical protein RC98_13575 [Pectobacterium carotovorum subsp. carotovorum]|uniref:hypothetical protein n=1 Tax=Pectobacterium carotovorum TaxID=554 RepID=UPI00057FF342|nr:hypothetical protein [Pectobacterium carotovorum]KHT26728.1 hypothetical protein RC98_13575 [Pectobacterium carotovorum subsp. carotovorum]
MRSTKNPHDDNNHYADEIKNRIATLVKQEEAREKKKQEIISIFASLADKIKAASDRVALTQVLQLTVKDVQHTLTGQLGNGNDPDITLGIKVVTIESDAVTLTFAPGNKINFYREGLIQFEVQGKQKPVMMNGVMKVDNKSVNSNLAETYTLIYKKDTGWSLIIHPDVIQERTGESLTEEGVLRIIYGFFQRDLGL